LLIKIQKELAMRKYENLSELQKKLLDRKIIDLPAEVDIDMALYVREALMRLRAKGSPEIEIRITSNGGNIIYGLNIYDDLRNYAGKKIGVVVGVAGSIAAIILQACDVRKSYRHSCLLIHHVSKNSVSLDDLEDEYKNKKLVTALQKDQQLLYAILMERTGRTLEELKVTCAKAEDMTTPEALEYGLIDEII
jgi:ATP-dependent Clp protease protease subunit